MDIGEFITPLAIGAIGGLISAGITYGLNRRGRRDSMQLEQLRETTVAMATNARQMLRFLGAHKKGNVEPDDAEAMNRAHAEVRIGCDALALVGNRFVQEAARLLRHHAYSVAQAARDGSDKHPDYGVSVHTRFEWAIEMLLEASRKQIGLSGHVVRDFDPKRLTIQSEFAEKRLPQKRRFRRLGLLKV
jgi:hypothetical protein